jgi:hypothetical protein
MGKPNEKRSIAMLVDDKGRLFKKINLIDLLVIIVVLAVGIFAINKFSEKKIITPFTKADRIVVTFYSEDLPSYAVSAMKVGDEVKDKTTNSVFGKVTNVEQMPSVAFGVDENGIMVKSSKEGYASMLLTVEGDGIFSDNGAYFGNIDYYINRYLEIRVGNTAVYTKVRSIEKK